MINFHGIIVGVAAFLIIGLFHPVVIRGEYYFGTRIWPLFAIFGVVVLMCSIFVHSILVKSILGITGFTLLWCIIEIFEQAKRVKKGWFPENPKRQ
jgi:hypothetical protein